MYRHVVSIVMLGVCAAPAAAQPFAAQSWRITEIGGVNLDEQAQARTALVFDAAQVRVSGTIGCNRLMGGYKMEGEALSIGPLAATRMACPDELNAREHAFATALTQTRHWRVTADGLILSGGDAKILIRARPQPAGTGDK